MRKAWVFSLILCMSHLFHMPSMAADYDLTAWTWRRPVETHNITGFVRVPIPTEVFNDTQPGLVDLRVVDDAGRLVPHLLEWSSSLKEGQVEWRPARLLNASQANGKYSRIVADFGRVEEKNAIQVSVSGSNFRRRVKIEGSNNAVGWNQLGGVHLLFDVTVQGQRQRIDILRLPPNNYRFLRLTVYNMPDETGPVAIRSVNCASRKEISDKDLVPIWPNDLSIEQEENGNTLIRLDLGFRNLPIKRLRIHADDPYFYRGYVLSGGNQPPRAAGRYPETIRTKAEQGEPIRLISTGVFYRLKEKEGSFEHLTVDDSSIRYRYLELRICNGDNPPLKITGIDLWRGTVHLIFEAHPGQSYALIGGNPAASSPRYDLAKSVGGLDRWRLPVVELGPATKKAEGTTPWTERHGTVILLVLSALAGGMAYLAIRSMRNLTRNR